MAKNKGARYFERGCYKGELYSANELRGMCSSSYLKAKVQI